VAKVLLQHANFHNRFSQGGFPGSDIEAPVAQEIISTIIHRTDFRTIAAISAVIADGQRNPVSVMWYCTNILFPARRFRTCQNTITMRRKDKRSLIMWLSVLFLITRLLRSIEVVLL
jgi:hypothetical protein